MVKMKWSPEIEVVLRSLKAGAITENSQITSRDCEWITYMTTDNYFEKLHKWTIVVSAKASESLFAMKTGRRAERDASDATTPLRFAASGT